MKYKSLFLQGDSKIGKSTIILESIKPFLSVTTGFMCQRLIADGETKAFCLTPIELVTSPVAKFDEKMPNIFLKENLGRWQRNEEVFCNTGVMLLSDLKGKQLVVLDEIGGMELLIEPFREKLYEVLSNGIPCIGVMKSYNNKTLMQKSVGLELRYEDLHEKLYKDIESVFGGAIISAKDYNRSYLKNTVETFLSGTMKMM